MVFFQNFEEFEGRMRCVLVRRFGVFIVHNAVRLLKRACESRNMDLKAQMSLSMRARHLQKKITASRTRRWEKVAKNRLGNQRRDMSVV